MVIEDTIRPRIRAAILEETVWSAIEEKLPILEEQSKAL